VVALDRTTGDELWRGPLGGTGRGFALAGGTIFATVERDGSPAQLAAFPALGCGDPVCAPTRTSTLEGTGTGDPAVAGGVVYTSTDTAVQGFDASGCGAATCPALVTVPVAEGGAVSVSDGHVLVSGRGTLTAFALG
jgi:outer membrane protein assembly factor BamB